MIGKRLKLRSLHPCTSTVTLETAHPAKFPDVMEAEIGQGCVQVPERLAILANREKVAIPPLIPPPPVRPTALSTAFTPKANF
jgi:threonine synthase